MTFSLEKANLRREDTFRRKQRFEVMLILMIDLLLTNMWLFTSGDWSHVDYLWMMFLSDVWSGLSLDPSTAKDPLVSK